MQYGAGTRLWIKSAAKLRADEHVSRLLDCEFGTHCIRPRGTGSERNETVPYCVIDIYRVATADQLTQRLTSAKGAIFAIFDELVLDRIGPVEQLVSARKMDSETAHQLDGKGRDPMLIIGRRPHA